MYPRLFACTAFLALAVGMGVPTSAENPDHVRQVRETRQCEGCDLRDADLEALQVELGNLRDADFRGAILYKSNFRGADLTGAMFAEADLTGADLRGSKGANLTGAVTDERTKCPNGVAGPCN
jgi:hypothetical protein